MKQTDFAEISLLGVRFHKLTVKQLINYIVEKSQIDSKTIVGHVNVRGANLAYDLPWYRDFLNQSADIVFCDGFGVLLGAKLLGNSVESKHRMTAPDYIEDLALACAKNNVSLFLLAGKPGVVEKAINKLKAVAPDLRIDGHHGYFDKSNHENEEVIQQINEFNPNILYVGFGMPLQERWILDNLDAIEARLFLPLGACLDFYTDSVSRGPRWMTDNGFEWLSRLLVQPSQVWQRYIIGNPLFFYRVLRQKLKMSISKK